MINSIPKVNQELFNWVQINLQNGIYTLELPLLEGPNTYVAVVDEGILKVVSYDPIISIQKVVEEILPDFSKSLKLLPLIYLKLEHKNGGLNIEQIGEGDLQDSLEELQQKSIDFTTESSFPQYKMRALQKEFEQVKKELKVANTRLASIQKFQEEFVHSVSHHISAPVRHIKGYANWLMEDEEDQLSEYAKGELQKIVSTVDRYDQMVSDLVRYVREDEWVSEKYLVDLSPILQELQDTFSANYLDRNITWIVSPLPKVSGNKKMVSHLFEILLSNAVKFTERETEAIIQISWEENEKEYIFLIEDNGAGFDMKYVDRLFKIFQRLHSKEEFEGNGLGLAHAKSIVEAHGGRIWTESILEESSKFYFSLPKELD